MEETAQNSNRKGTENSRKERNKYAIEGKKESREERLA
jgi:hypothetical protein